VQIPAGTVNQGENPESTARREGAEETGLEGLVLMRSLGQVDDLPRLGYVLVAQHTLVYSRPDKSSFDWVHLPTGLPVKVLRHSAGLTQICYEENDRYIEPQYTTYSITGWVPDEALTNHCVRHFYLFDAPNPSPERWSVGVDNHIFELFWAPLNDLPSIVPSQDSWLNVLGMLPA